MVEQIYKLGIDVGNNLVKIIGDEIEQPLVYPASLTRYADALYMFNNNIDYLEENGFEIFSLAKDNVRSCYIWGRNLYKFGQLTIHTKGVGNIRYENQLYKKLVLFAIAKYVDSIDERKLMDEVVLTIAMGMPDNEYASSVTNNFKSISWLIGEHTVFVDNLPVKFKIKNVEVIPQEFGSLILFEKIKGGITPDIRTMVIDYGAGTRLRTIYDGFRQRDSYQDTLGVNQLIDKLFSKIKEDGIKNSRRNNHIGIQEMLMSKNYEMKTGVSTTQDFTELFLQEIGSYTEDRFEEDVYSGYAFNNIDLVILTGGGANLLERLAYSQLGQESWIPEQPETANVRGFYEYLKNKAAGELNEAKVGEDSFVIGDKVKISETAIREANGYDLKAHRNWEGEIIDITKDSRGSSVYAVKYPSGEKNLYVKEQDLIKL